MFMSGCASQDNLSLTPAPVLYNDSTVDTFAHLKPESQNNCMNILYVTNCESYTSNKMLKYGNEIDSEVHFGEATVRMREKGSNWRELFK